MLFVLNFIYCLPNCAERAQRFNTAACSGDDGDGRGGSSSINVLHILVFEVYLFAVACVFLTKLLALRATRTKSARK